MIITGKWQPNRRVGKAGIGGGRIVKAGEKRGKAVPRGISRPAIRHHIHDAACLIAPTCQLPVLHRNDRRSVNTGKAAMRGDHRLGQQLCAAASLYLGHGWHTARFIVQNSQTTILHLVDPVGARLDRGWPGWRFNRYVAVNFHM